MTDLFATDAPKKRGRAAKQPDPITEVLPADDTCSALVAQTLANPIAVFTSPENFTAFTKRLRDELANFTPDLTTAKGRKEIAKRSMDVRRAKTRLDEAGLKLTEDARATIATVNASRSTIKAELDALAIEVRAPLDEWEAKELARVNECERIISGMRSAAIIAEDDTSATVRARGAVIWDTALDADLFGDGLADAQAAKEAAVQALGTAAVRLKKAEDDARRLAELEAAEASRLAREAEELAAREAQAAAKREAEEAAAREQQRIADEVAAKEAAAKAEADRIQKAKDDAAQAEREKAEREREAERQAERDAAEARQREHDAALAAAREEAARAKRLQEAEAARIAEVERKREADELAERQAQAKRDADRAHRTACKTAAKQAIMALGLAEDDAAKVVLALIGGDVPHATWSF